MVEVPLTQGKVALIDDEDAPRILAYKWTLSHNPNRRRGIWYAVRYTHKKGSSSRTVIQMHREIMNAPDGMEVDHKNGDGLDNRKSNLRIATRSQNLGNCHKQPGRTGYRGVYWHRRNRMYHALIRHEGKRHSLGYYYDAEAAGRAYDYAAYQLRGEFASLNFPQDVPPKEIPRVVAGAKNRGKSKLLSKSQIIEIQRRLARGDNRKALAAEFGISLPTLWKIKSRGYACYQI
jgi:HNH endonuclease